MSELWKGKEEQFTVMVYKPYYITIWTRQIIRISAEENLVFNFYAFGSFSVIRVKGFFCLLVKFLTNRVCYNLYFCNIVISYLHVFTNYFLFHDISILTSFFCFNILHSYLIVQKFSSEIFFKSVFFFTVKIWQRETEKSWENTRK